MPKQTSKMIIEDTNRKLEIIQSHISRLVDTVNTMRSFMSESLISVAKNQQDLHHRLEYIKTYISPVSFDDVMGQECSQAEAIKIKPIRRKH